MGRQHDVAQGLEKHRGHTVPARWGDPLLMPSRRPGCPPSRSGRGGGTWAAPRSAARRAPSVTAAASRGPAGTGWKRKRRLAAEHSATPCFEATHVTARVAKAGRSLR